MKITYLRNAQDRIVGCVASEVTDGYVRYGMSVYNPNDHFSKRLGREIAEGRLRHSYREICLEDASLRHIDIFAAIMRDVVQERLLSMRAVKAAEFWLVRYNWNR